MIKTGSVVECVDGCFDAKFSTITLPVKGCLYYVTGIREFNKGIGLYLDEIKDLVRIKNTNRVIQASFHIDRFREIKVDIEDFCKLKEEIE